MSLNIMKNENLEEMVMSFNVQIGDNFVVQAIEGNVEGVDFMSYNVSNLNSWFVNLLYVFGVVNLKWEIMLWLGPITKSGGRAINPMCI
jgi:hypothetical protein